MRMILILFLISILTPITWESEIWGMGEHVAIDAVSFRTVFAGVFFAVEWNSSSTMAQIPDTFEVIFPQLNPITLLVCAIGILSPFVSALALTNRIGIRESLLVIILSVVLLAFAPLVNILRVEEFYTYQMRPLIVPQIVSPLVLIWHSRTQNRLLKTSLKV